MALPPTIPTSFVPHTPASQTRRYRVDFMGAFGFLSYMAFIIVIVLAIGVFLYSQMLTAQKQSKDAELAKALEDTNTDRAASFVRLQNRLTSGKTLLDNHVALTGFFRSVETLLPATVRFSSLRVSLADGKKVSLEGSGIAKTFNALAAASASFASDGHIRDAIFSHIAVNRDNSVSFTLTATLDQELVSFDPGSATSAPPPETTSTTP